MNRPLTEIERFILENQAAILGALGAMRLNRDASDTAWNRRNIIMDRLHEWKINGDPVKPE